MEKLISDINEFQKIVNSNTTEILDLVNIIHNKLKEIQTNGTSHVSNLWDLVNKNIAKVEKIITSTNKRITDGNGDLVEQLNKLEMKEETLKELKSDINEIQKIVNNNFVQIIDIEKKISEGIIDIREKYTINA